MTKIKNTLKLEKLNKIYHISDIHIRNFKRHEEYRRVFARLFKYIKSTFTDDSLILLTGDIVHAKTDVTPELIQEVQSLLKSLADIGPVLMIPGNHDANLNNSHRLDALTPIVNALNLPNILYVKDTCEFTLADKTFVHWSVFDEQKDYIKADQVKGDYKIALFHGPVTGVLIDHGVQLLNQGLKISDFDGYDLALLGDIHTRQFLNPEKTSGYPGSLIQQNHGETLNHGIFVWNLETKSAEYVEIENDTAFATVNIDSGNYEKLSTDLPKNLFLRVRYKNTAQSQIKSIVSDIRQDYNLLEVSIQKVQDHDSLINGSRRLNSLDVRDINYQNTLLVQYIKDKHQIEDIDTQRLCEINTILNNSVSKSEVPRNSMWLPKKFKFDNMFSYGKGNQIDFTTMEGTYGIFAPNASGKSAMLESITYCIFDKCSKTNKAAQVMNNQSNSFYCKLEFELHGKDYIIERKGTKQKTGNVKVNVDFYYIEGEEKISLNGKDRNDTNANIRAILGNYEDFILTTLSVQNNNTGFIDMSQSDRKDLLSQFLDINLYEELYQLANNESRDLSVLLKQHQKEDYHTTLMKVNYDIDTFDIALEAEELSKNTLETKSQQIQANILEKTKELVKIETVVDDVEELESKKSSIEVAKSKINEAIEENKLAKESLINKINESQSKVDSYDVNQLEQDSQKYQELNEYIIKKNLEISKKQANLQNSMSKMKKLSELTYDENCQHCMNNILVKDAIEAKRTYTKDQQELIEIQSPASQLESEADKLKKSNEKLTEYNDVMASHQKLVIEKSRLDLESSKLEKKLNDANTILKEVEFNIAQYYKQKKSIEKNKAIQEDIKELNNKKYVVDSTLSEVNKEITNLLIESRMAKAKKEKCEQSIKELQDLECKFKDYQYYLEAVHRDGIPHNLIASIIPQVEEEINNILAQIVDFSIVLQASDKSINAYIAYNENEYWPLELTSGMEKFVASLAIRTSLINISSLPRPNFIAIDEGFGSLDQTNLNSMVMLFDYLKTQFKFIMIISHIDSMRDVVDNHLEIAKINGRSKIDHI